MIAVSNKDQNIIIEEAPDYAMTLAYGQPGMVSVFEADAEPAINGVTIARKELAMNDVSDEKVLEAQEAEQDIIEMIADNDPNNGDGRLELVKKVKDAVDAGLITAHHDQKNLMDLHAIGLEYLDARDESVYAGVAFIVFTAALLTSGGLMAARTGPSWLRSPWTAALLVPVAGAFGVLLWNKHNAVKDAENKVDTQIALIQSVLNAKALPSDVQGDAADVDTLPAAIPADVTQAPPAQGQDTTKAAPDTVIIDGKETPVGGYVVTGAVDPVVEAKVKAGALFDRIIWPEKVSPADVKVLAEVLNYGDDTFWASGGAKGSNWVDPMFRAFYEASGGKNAAGRERIMLIGKAIGDLPKTSGKSWLPVRPGGDGVMRIDVTELAKFINSQRG